MGLFRHKEITTIELLDKYINYLTDNRISFISNDVRPSMTPDIQQIYIMYNQARKSENINFAINLYDAILSKWPNFVAARYNLA